MRLHIQRQMCAPYVRIDCDMSARKVQILLSTYNGEKFLCELMDSLLAQDYPCLEILVRDDGSSDGTRDILLDYSGKHENVQAVFGPNLGVVHSFLKLIEISSLDADYFAFCDQDDVWLPEKVTRAVNVLEAMPPNIPLLYCSRVTIVDEQLRYLGMSKLPQRPPSFENALVENVATGCTIVINASSKRLLLCGTPRNALMHDWWMYLVVAAFGEVIYDSQSLMLYRQHDSNVVGYEQRALALWFSRLKRFFDRGRNLLITPQAEEFRELYGSLLRKRERDILDRFLNERITLIGRLHYALNGDVYRQSVIDNAILRFLIAIDRI